MSFKISTTLLTISCCTALGLSYCPQAQATSPNLSAQAVQQVRKVSGHVVDADGPIIGASIVEKGNPKNGAVTDLDGNFSLNVRPGATLVVSYIGYKTQEVTVGNQPDIAITLKNDEKTLEDVVVVGYGVQKKKLVTGATVEVKGDNIEKLNTTQVLGALQSQSPGVTIQAASGQPGDGYRVNIRGAGSSGDSAPIYVIDGVTGGDINALNPADIERIDVLKDAASCAIYGSRGANGVILITTKQGKQGKITVSYDGNIGWQNMYKRPQMLNAKQYMDVMDIVRMNAGMDPYDWSRAVDSDLLKAYQDGSNEGTDWIEAMRNENAVVTNHAINVAGGSDRSKFSTGIGYQYQDGIIGGPVKSDFRRFTFRINSEHIIYRDNAGTDVVKFGENLYYEHAQNQGIQIGNMYSNALSDAIRAIPIIPEYNKDGSYVGYDDMKAMGTKGMFDYYAYAANPVLNLLYQQSGNNKQKNFNLSAIGYVEVQPVKGLVYRGQIGYKQYSSSWRSFLPVFQMNPSNSRSNNITNDNLSLGWSWVLTNTLDYKFEPWKNHHFDALVGIEYSKSRPDYGESVNAQAYNNIFDDMKHAYLDNTQRNGSYVTGTPADFGSKMSYFGRINYDYNEKYMFSAIFRADGSSKFPRNKRWGYFPSFSAGWVISNEAFMQNVHWFDFLKFRAGWGQNGNDEIPSYSYLSGYDFGSKGLYAFGTGTSPKGSPTQGAYPNRLSSPDLTWETSEQTDLGIDARFFTGRLSFTGDWYYKKTKDLLLYVQTPGITGFSNAWKNAGTVRNTGVELTFGWNDKVGKDFAYGINYNIAMNSNKVTKVSGENDYIEGGFNLLGQGMGNTTRIWEGHAIGCFYGYKTDGVIQNEADLKNYIDKNCGGDAANSLQGSAIKPGDLKFVDTNGDGKITSADKTDLGDPHPDVTMGLSFNLGYKGFDFSVTGYTALGQQVVRSWRKMDNKEENYTTEVFDCWHGEGTSNKYPLLTPSVETNWLNVSDIFIENADYFRLQNLTVGYDFKHLWTSCPFQQLRLYFAAQNLFTITGYKGMDPENGMALIDSEKWSTGIDVGNYPAPRTYMVGVNIKF